MANHSQEQTVHHGTPRRHLRNNLQILKFVDLGDLRSPPEGLCLHFIIGDGHPGKSSGAPGLEGSNLQYRGPKRSTSVCRSSKRLQIPPGKQEINMALPIHDITNKVKYLDL